MSKYIIELGEDANMVQVISVTQNGNAYIDSTVYVEYLEQLNSDYINEHFGDLQDTAYKKGFEDGKEYGLEESDMREAVSYQRGLEDAWECGKKLAWTAKYGGYGERLSDVFGRDDTFDFYDYTPNEAIEKLKAFEQKQDKIEVGDELEHTVSGYTSKAIFLEKIVADEDWYKCLFWTGCGVAILSYPKSQFKRTGKHYGIDKILEAMKHD